MEVLHFNESSFVSLEDSGLGPEPFPDLGAGIPGLLPGYDVRPPALNASSHVDLANETWLREAPSPAAPGDHSSSPAAIVGITFLFCVIGIVGIAGNSIIIFIIVLDRKMRGSVTNLFIMNLALSDLLIMLMGVPDTVQFILDKGWLLGEVACKLERYVLVISLYSSVVTAVAVCIERLCNQLELINQIIKKSAYRFRQDGPDRVTQETKKTLEI